MKIRPGTRGDANAVADFWNTTAQDHESAWKYSPTKTAADIENLLDEGFTLVVAHEDQVLIGFGLWQGERNLGVAATGSEPFYRVLRAWAEENPAQAGIAILPGSPSYERTWLDALEVWNFQAMGHKPLAPDDDPATRKVWTYRATVDLDRLKAAIDGQLGG